MRTTARTLTCDRCGEELTVRDFSWSGLSDATDYGWSRYATSTARSKIEKINAHDLCPTCTRQMRDVAHLHPRQSDTPNITRVYSIKYQASTLLDEELVLLRDWMTKELKKRRKK